MIDSDPNLIQIVNELQDKLNSFGVDRFDLPQIAVIGGQSAGKSSVLENFVGKDFLPRGNNIVTRRPLVLQLINDQSITNPYGEFLHLPGQKFNDFAKIRQEICDETDRELSGSLSISSKPINLKIYSPDVLDLTLVDLPGMTRVPVGDQPKDIEIRIKNMILEFIEKESCIILAVTAANQDLATSDAIKLAAQVDPDGKRTIGVLTKLDLMDEGTNARDILMGKHLPLRMGYIGIINRSQKDINDNKDMGKALDDEHKYFLQHKAYRDLTNKLGVSYLQNYLHKELLNHISRQLPPLKDKFNRELDELNDKIESVSYPLGERDKELILSKCNEAFRKNFESAVGGRGWKMDLNKLSGGAKINLLMNDTFAKEIDRLFYDENRLRREIATAIQNFYGVYLGIFTPDAAFRACVEHQIEHFRMPSLVCVDGVVLEINNIVRECVNKIDKYSNMREMFAKLTLEFVGVCKKKCKSYVEHTVESEKAYLNTIHEDFIKMTRLDNSRNVIESKPISEAQLIATAQVLQNQRNPKSAWIKYKKNNFWFVIENGKLYWYKDQAETDKISSIVLRGCQLKDSLEFDSVLILVLPKKKSAMSEMELVFTSVFVANKWREWLIETGVKTDESVNNSNQTNINKEFDSESVNSLQYYDNSLMNDNSYEDMAQPDHMRAQVDQVKRLVDAYIVILKKKFKDSVPKLCTLELIDSTAHFIAVELKLRINNQINGIDDIVGGDEEEKYANDLINRQKHYSEAIDIIERVSKHK